MRQALNTLMRFFGYERREDTMPRKRLLPTVPLKDPPPPSRRSATPMDWLDYCRTLEDCGLYKYGFHRTEYNISEDRKWMLITRTEYDWSTDYPCGITLNGVHYERRYANLYERV